MSPHPEPAQPEQTPNPSPADDDTAKYGRIGAGCFTFFVGGAAGSMLGVFVAKAIDIANRCTPPEGLPACGDWHYFFFGGGLIGALSLTSITLWRLRRGASRAE